MAFVSFTFPPQNPAQNPLTEYMETTHLSTLQLIKTFLEVEAKLIIRMAVQCLKGNRYSFKGNRFLPAHFTSILTHHFQHLKRYSVAPLATTLAMAVADFANSRINIQYHYPFVL